MCDSGFKVQQLAYLCECAFGESALLCCLFLAVGVFPQGAFLFWREVLECGAHRHQLYEFPPIAVVKADRVQPSHAISLPPSSQFPSVACRRWRRCVCRRQAVHSVSVPRLLLDGIVRNLSTLLDRIVRNLSTRLDGIVRNLSTRLDRIVRNLSTQPAFLSAESSYRGRFCEGRRSACVARLPVGSVCLTLSQCLNLSQIVSLQRCGQAAVPTPCRRRSVRPCARSCGKPTGSPVGQALTWH